VGVMVLLRRSYPGPGLRVPLSVARAMVSGPFERQTSSEVSAAGYARPMTPEQILLLVVTALAGAIATIMANGVTGAFAARARLRRLQELELCEKLLDLVEAESDAARVLITERDEVVSRMAALSARRPLWRSFFSYVLGFMFVAVPMTLIFLLVSVFVPGLVWSSLIGVLVGAALIFAVETQPLFARPLLSKFRPGQHRSKALDI